MATVLVVEDEFLIRAFIVSVLEEEGFRIVEASNADEAISILERREDIRLLFTDVDMPGSMDGLRLAEAVRLRWPPVEIIVTSGKRTPSVLPERAVFVAKPYQAPRLIETINSML